MVVFDISQRYLESGLGQFDLLEYLFVAINNDTKAMKF